MNLHLSSEIRLIKYHLHLFAFLFVYLSLGWSNIKCCFCFLCVSVGTINPIYPLNLHLPCQLMLFEQKFFIVCVSFSWKYQAFFCICISIRSNLNILLWISVYVLDPRCLNTVYFSFILFFLCLCLGRTEASYPLLSVFASADTRLFIDITEFVCRNVGTTSFNTYLTVH